MARVVVMEHVRNHRNTDLCVCIRMLLLNSRSTAENPPAAYPPAKSSTLCYQCHSFSSFQFSRASMTRHFELCACAT